MRRSTKWGAAGVVLLIILGVGFFALYAASMKNSERHVVATVDDKERVCDSDSEGKTTCKYLVFTDQGTFKVVDTILFGRMNSSDFYGRIKRDRTYDFTVVGYRNGFMSEYPNIIEMEELRQ